MSAANGTPPRPLVTIPTAARDIFRMPASTLYLWARRGELAGAVQINGHWYVKVAEARRWLDGQLGETSNGHGA